MRESGEQYNETIEVDTEKQTELFKVPAHGNVDHFNILHDFKKVCLVTSKKAQIGVRIYGNVDHELLLTWRLVTQTLFPANWQPLQ